MSITFTKIPQATLDTKSSQASGIAQPPKPAEIGMDTNEFHAQVMQLAHAKTPIEQVNHAIDQHPDITDKPRAKSMAQAVYTILGVDKAM